MQMGQAQSLRDEKAACPSSASPLWPSPFALHPSLLTLHSSRSCIAHSLELAHDRTRVTWDNPNAGVKYMLTPKAGFEQGDLHCRVFELRRSLDGRTENLQWQGLPVA